MSGKRIFRYFNLLFIIVCLLVSLFPIYWMLNTSLKTQGEIYRQIPTLIPQSPTLDAYKYLYTGTEFLTSLKNSLLIALSVATFSILVAFPVSYAVARIKFKGRNFLTKSILITYLIPASVLYIPLYMFVSSLKLTNSIYGLMLIYPTFTLPYVAWMLIPQVGSVPYEIEEASIIDGCNRLQSMVKIVFPLSFSGVVSTFIVSFSMSWGEYLYALVNISSSDQKTFPLVISGLIFGDIYPWGQIMAGAITACVPILLIYIIASNFVVGGVTAGGVKQ